MAVPHPPPGFIWGDNGKSMHSLLCKDDERWNDDNIPLFEPYRDFLRSGLVIYDQRYISQIPPSRITTELPFLESLSLVKCHGLATIPESIDQLVNLRELDLTDSESIQFLPGMCSLCVQ
jgi:hypothetical protein